MFETDNFLERRSKERIECNFSALVRQYRSGGKQFEDKATITNLSANGLYLRIDRHIDPGNELFVLVRFSNTTQSENRSPLIAMRGPVVRSVSQPDGARGIAVKLNQHRFL